MKSISRAAVLRRQVVRPADPGVVELVLRQRRRDAALAEVDLDQAERLAVRGDPADGVADVERGMRPGRLGQVLDRDRDPGVALDQQDVAGLQHPAQRRDVGVGDRAGSPAAARRACAPGGGRSGRRGVSRAAVIAAPPRPSPPPSHSPGANRARDPAASPPSCTRNPRRASSSACSGFVRSRARGIRTCRQPDARLAIPRTGVTSRPRADERRSNEPGRRRRRSTTCCGRRTAATQRAYGEFLRAVTPLVAGSPGRAAAGSGPT